MDAVATTLALIAALLVLGALGEFVFERTGVPDVVWLVASGILAGPVLQIVSPALLTPGIPFFGAIALTIILSNGAFRLRLAEVAAAAPRGISLGVVGFTFSLIAIGVFFWLATRAGLVREVPPLLWLMTGAIVGGTSSVIVMPTVSKGSVPARVARVVEVESAATDALSIVVAMVIIDLLVSGVLDVSRPFVTLARGLGVGVLLGVVAAALLIPLIPPLRDKAHGYTLFLGSMLALYAITESFGGSGALAVLTSALLVGNAASVVPKLFPGAHVAGLRPVADDAGDAGSDVVPDQVVLLLSDRSDVSDRPSADRARGGRCAVPPAVPEYRPCCSRRREMAPSGRSSGC